MGDSKLCLLLLLSISALALAKRYKALHKYQYQYEAESMNAINGASPLKNGPKASCIVELEVPQTCSFIIRTTGCSLTEVVDTDAGGNPVFRPAPSSEAFAAEMEKYPLKFVIEGVYDVKLYPEDGETTTILNIKRGIISALAVPLLEEDKNKNMPTIHGKCKTHYQVNAREDIATDITLNRDLSRCDRFVPIGDYTSPLALIAGMRYPLAQLVRSSQTCNYKFDNEKKHMTSGSCTENHILIPFSHKGEYGVTNVGKQELTLVQVFPHNDRVFEHSDIVKGLHMEAVEDKSVIQDKDAVLKLLRELATLPESEGERRANLFHELVTIVRGMKTATLSPAIPEALAVSHVLTYQVLAQCGTPECSSAIMQILRTFDSSSFKIDATVFAMGLLSNPSALLISDMLEMAKYKPSKSVMYALSNVVKRFYNAEGKLIPEIHSVAEFMAKRLGDCSGDDDDTFLTLRVGISPNNTKSAVIKCVNQPSASLAVQQAAIQVYRLTPVPDNDREVLMQVLLDGASPVQKRIAAYLVLMKDPQPSELVRLTEAISSEQDVQVKSFVISHITNILSSTDPETQEQKIRDALQGNEIGPLMDGTKFSHNYKTGSVEGNMIFEGTSYLPKEVMLEMTLKAFGYDIDMMEIGIESKGFEPTVDALFGENGFFPDTALKTMYFVSDNVPLSVNEILQNMLPALKKNRMKRQVISASLEIGDNINKLMKELENSQSPEAMVYLRLLGNELGYLRTSEMEGMAYSLMAALMTKGDNTIFAHYIFMDNEFFLPTLTGVPLRIALSGTFTPGIKGGLKIARDMNEVTFMPSAAVEFETHFGSHIPEYVNSGLEMHTNIFHESGLNAKIAVTRDQVKLTIPAPTSPTKLIKITNTLVAVTGTELKTIPPSVMDRIDVSKCTSVFAGMNYCTALQYTDAFSQETSPYFPFTGDSKFAVELHPTGEVTEYTATVGYELLREGEEGRQRVDSVKFILRAEGAEPTEARAIFKYNRRKNVITADIQIPDFDVEAGLRLSVVDGNTRGKGTHSISLDFINKNIPQLSLVGRANLKAMKEGMLQGQLLVPSINADATVTANMKSDGELAMELKSEIKFMNAKTEQKIAMTYDGKKIAVGFKSDVNTKTSILPGANVFEKYGNTFLDTKVGQTDVKVRHIFKKFVEAANNYMEKYGADIPYIQNLRVPDMPEISLPETLFLTTEAKAAYHFNNEHFTIAIPLPLGGKSTEEFNFPPVLTTPTMYLPQLGLEIVSMEIPLPEFVIPESLSLSIPLFGKVEASTLMKSNLYNMEASMAVGKDTFKKPRYSATFDFKGTSPLDILSIKFEGISEKILIINVEFLTLFFSIAEETIITDKIYLKSSSKIEAMSPFGVSFALEHTGMTGIDGNEISADNNFEGMFKAGPMYGKTISNQSFAIFPFRPEAKFDSTIQFDSTIIRAQNTIAAALANGEFSVMSNTNAFEDILTHVAELSFKDRKLSLKWDGNARALGMKIRNQAEASAGASEVIMRIETNAEHSENQANYLLTASLDSNGSEINSNAIVTFSENKATHKAAVKINKDGLTASGKTTLQSPLSLENSFNVGVDFSKATLSITNRAALANVKVNNANILTITLSSLDFNSKSEAAASEYASYTHDITIGLKPYSASADVDNNLKLLATNFINEAKLRAELSNIDLTGSLKATSGNDEIKHTYQLSYVDMTATAKFSTTGNVFGMKMNQNTDLEVAGLAAMFTSVARFNSQSMRFDHSIRCSIVPFNVNFDAIFNADGEITLYGKHSGQLYGKFLLKAHPLAFASVHECRASVTHTLDNEFSLETTFDNKMDTVLSLQEQKTSFRITSKMNEHAFNHGMSIYNTAERTGIEISSTILTNILNTDSPENQEFTISGFLKYDKNTNVIQFPLIENLPAILENIKGSVAEVLLFIDYDELGDLLEALPRDVSELISELNIEGMINRLKQHFNDFMQESISIEDLKAFQKNLERSVESLLFGALFFTGHVLTRINEVMSANAVVQEIQQHLQALDKKYDISIVIIRNIEYVIDIIDKMISPCIEELPNLISEDFLKDPVAYVIEVAEDLDILGKINIFHAKIKELIVKFEVDRIIQAALDKSVELNKQFRIGETISAVLTSVYNANILNMKDFESAIKYFKSIEVKDIIQQINLFIEIMVQQLNMLNYNYFVDSTNEVIAVCTARLNKLIMTSEIPQKLVATKDFVNFVLSSVRGFMEHLREIKIAEIIEIVQDIIDKGVIGNIKEFAKLLKQKIANVNVRDGIIIYLEVLNRCYINFITTITDTFIDIVERIEEVTPKQKITKEIQQIINGFSKELKKAEFIVPSFTIPLTDLIVPSTVIQMGDLKIPMQLEIPEFTIMGTFLVEPTTVSFDDIKQIIIKLIDFIVNIDIKGFDVDAFLGDLKMNYLPSIPEITFPEITIPEISFPTIPNVPVERLFNSLQVPEIKLPTIPTEIIVLPCFGKLSGEIKFLTPIYTLKMSAEFKNSTENEMAPQFTGFLSSQATSPHFEILNYKLDSTTRIAIPKMSRVVLTETMKFNHLALGLDHQASVTFYGQSAQAQAKTTVKVTTKPYTASIVNTAVVAVEEGMSASLNTIYNHKVDLPCIDVRCEATVTQKSIAHQHGLTFTLTVDNSGESTINGDKGNHKSNLQLSLTPSTVKLTFSGDTDSNILKVKQQITAESGTFNYFKFNVRNEAEAPAIKNSLLVVSGHGNLYDMKVELKGNHDTELHGEVSGVLSNSINFVARPVEFVYEFQNKGNVMVSIFKSVIAKIDLQNDYSVILRPESQQVATVALARLNDYKIFYNFTLNNNENEAGIFVAMESAGNLHFLTVPFSIPEIDLPSIDFHTPAISDLNLYEHIGLQSIFTSTEQTVNADAKIVYQKSQAAPLAYVMGLIQIPHVGNVITELSFKSAIINLNANAGLYAEDNLVFRLGATTVSVFEGLKAKLHGTTSLTAKRGLKLASSLSLENRHIECSHNSTISISPETFETAVSVVTVAKIDLPILNLETKQSLVANTQTKPNAISSLTMKGDFNIPVINTVGTAEAAHNLKLDGTFKYISMESTTKAKLDGTVLTNSLVWEFLDNEVNVYLNHEGLRSTSKVAADLKLNHGTTKVIAIYVNENLDIEASLSHVYAVLKYTGNNEAKLPNFNTKGKHTAQATIDLAPTSSLTANVEIDIFQPSNLGDLIIQEKTVAEVTVPKQKISTNAKFSSPLYTINLEADLEGHLPVFKMNLKSSGSSDIVLLEYDMQVQEMLKIHLCKCLCIASSTANIENDALSMISKFTMTGNDLTMEVDHVITQALRYVSRHTLNVEITSPTVTYGNLHYDAGSNGLSTSVSTLYTGLLGLQFNAGDPSQINARVYGLDVDILVMRSSSKDADKMHLDIVYDMEASKVMFSELMFRLYSIFTTFVISNEFLADLTEHIAAKIEMAVYETSQFVDSVKSDYLDEVVIYINVFYDQVVTTINNIIYQIAEQNKEQFNNAYDQIIDILLYLQQLYTVIAEYVVGELRQVSEEAGAYIKVSEGKLEINLAYPFQQ
uniref:Vitellogenin domain-containing protein n=1 Tax=Anabas testudineus TaxID=64144 RepID=A0A7N6FMC1_ANATE